MKEYKKVRTKLDGIQLVEFWDKNEFKGRTLKLLDIKGGLETIIDIPDSTIVCDLCNEGIDEFPVSVLHGYAMCKECYKDVIVNIQEGEDRMSLEQMLIKNLNMNPESDEEAEADNNTLKAIKETFQEWLREVATGIPDTEETKEMRNMLIILVDEP